jgi:hypothetical protein
MIQRRDCDIKRPLNCDFPTQPLEMSPDMLVTHTRPFLFAERLFSYDMACKVHDASDLGLERVTNETYILVKDMQNQLQSLLVALPPWLRPHDPDTSFDELDHRLPLQRENVLTTTLCTVYSMHRPHLVGFEQSRREVLSSTMSVLESQQRVFALTPQHHYGMFTLSFYTIDAALLLMSTAAAYPSDAWPSAQRIREVLGKAMENLSIMASQNALASTGLELLNRCYSQMDSLLRPSLEELRLPNASHDLGSFLRELTYTQAAALELDLWPTDQFIPEIYHNLNDTLGESCWNHTVDLNNSLLSTTEMGSSL